jgi:acyl-CoA thioester hydrolase
MGVAHHASYLLWFELGRTGLLREAGHTYREMERSGFLLPVLEYNVRFFVGAEYDDRVRIETGIMQLRSRTVTFAYRAVRGDDLLATGWTRHLCVDRDSRYRRLPAEIIEAISPFVIHQGEGFVPS